MRVSLGRKFSRGLTRLRRSRQFEFVQSRDHFVPVGSPPVHAATGGTTPECPMSGADPFRHRVLHILPGRTHEDLVAQRATGEWTDESEREGRGDLANLIVQDVGTNPDRTGDPGGEFLVPRQEDPVFGADSLDEGSIRARFRIRGVVTHEPQPTCETPLHVIAEELHASPREITSMSNRRVRLFAVRNLGSSNPGFHSRPPSSSETTKRLAARTPRCRATAQRAAASISTATTPRATSWRARARDSRYTASMVHVPPGRNRRDLLSKTVAIAPRRFSSGRSRRAFPKSPEVPSSEIAKVGSTRSPITRSGTREPQAPKVRKVRQPKAAISSIVTIAAGAPIGDRATTTDLGPAVPTLSHRFQPFRCPWTVRWRARKSPDVNTMTPTRGRCVSARRNPKDSRR